MTFNGHSFLIFRPTAKDISNANCYGVLATTAAVDLVPRMRSVRANHSKVLSVDPFSAARVDRGVVPCDTERREVFALFIKLFRVTVAAFVPAPVYRLLRKGAYYSDDGTPKSGLSV